jgi:transcriptional regulator with XRE-family HTH domain
VVLSAAGSYVEPPGTVVERSTTRSHRGGPHGGPGGAQVSVDSRISCIKRSERRASTRWWTRAGCDRDSCGATRAVPRTRRRPAPLPAGCAPSPKSPGQVVVNRQAIDHGQTRAMPPLERRRDRGRRAADQLLKRLGDELRIARTAAGLSQRTLAAMAGMSQAKVSRLERAIAPMAPLRAYAILFEMLGQAVALRTYPRTSPARDAGHVRLLRRFRALLPAAALFRTEVPLRRPGELRAWDGELVLVGGSCRVEAETVISDVQATDRRIGLKMADDGVDRVILLVADTRHNREVLRASRELLRARFPLDQGEVLRAIQSGRCPAQGGLVVL